MNIHVAVQRMITLPRVVFGSPLVRAVERPAAGRPAGVDQTLDALVAVAVMDHVLAVSDWARARTKLSIPGSTVLTGAPSDDVATFAGLALREIDRAGSGGAVFIDGAREIFQEIVNTLWTYSTAVRIAICVAADNAQQYVDPLLYEVSIAAEYVGRARACLMNNLLGRPGVFEPPPTVPPYESMTVAGDVTGGMPAVPEPAAVSGVPNPAPRIRLTEELLRVAIGQVWYESAGLETYAVAEKSPETRGADYAAASVLWLRTQNISDNAKAAGYVGHPQDDPWRGASMSDDVTMQLTVTPGAAGAARDTSPLFIGLSVAIDAVVNALSSLPDGVARLVDMEANNPTWRSLPERLVAVMAILEPSPTAVMGTAPLVDVPVAAGDQVPPPSPVRDEDPPATADMPVDADEERAPSPPVQDEGDLSTRGLALSIPEFPMVQPASARIATVPIAIVEFEVPPMMPVRPPTPLQQHDYVDDDKVPPPVLRKEPKVVGIGRQYTGTNQHAHWVGEGFTLRTPEEHMLIVQFHDAVTGLWVRAYY
jgi:hypothetical protein